MPVRHRLGWMLFLVSAALFTWSASRSGLGPGVAASVVFGVGCLLFLAPGRALGGDD